LEGQVDLPWDYFVLQAARGGIRVPEWVGLAITRSVGDHLGKSADQVTGQDVDAALEGLPGDPAPRLSWLFRRFEQPIPSPTAGLRLSEKSVRGSFRPVVAQLDLVHDAAVLLQQHYSAEHFFECTEGLEDPDTWDARAAVIAMLYVCLIRDSAAEYAVEP